MLPSPPAGFEWYVLDANSAQQQRTPPFRGLACGACLRVKANQSLTTAAVPDVELEMDKWVMGQ